MRETTASPQVPRTRALWCIAGVAGYPALTGFGTPWMAVVWFALWLAVAVLTTTYERGRKSAVLVPPGDKT